MPDDPQNDKEPEDPLRVELIKHLSAEITSSMDFLHTFRSRMAFSVLIGPFLILGSFAVAAAKVSVPLPKGNLPWSWVLDALCCYLLLGFFGAKLDQFLTKQCDYLRRTLLSVAKDEPLGNIRFEFPEKELGWNHLMAYLPGFVIVTLAVIVLGFLTR
jgi:hypothetical protein